MSPSEIDVEERLELTDYNWPLKRLDGLEVNFSNSKEKVVVVNFWATWCPPCIAEMPSLQKLYSSYGDDVDFYFVSNETPQVVQNFLNAKGYDLPAYITSSMGPKELQSKSLPTSYVISKNGEIAIRKTGAANWDSKSVHEIINKLLTQ